MSFFKSIGLFVRIIELIEKLIKKLEREKEIDSLVKAKDEALDKGTQEPLEEAIGGGGRPTKHEYAGMLTRERKKRE